MLYGIREICDVVLRAKGLQHIGTQVFHKDMPVLYFDSLKTSSLEGAATTVYATGGRGNTRLLAWEGEKTVTFTMEDALISPISLSVLSGAGVIESSQDTTGLANVKHATERSEVRTNESGDKQLLGLTYDPFIDATKDFYVYLIPLDTHGDFNGQPIRVDKFTALEADQLEEFGATVNITDLYEEKLHKPEVVMVDYYYKGEKAAVTQINIDAQNFAGNYYLEASTLWRNKNGEDIAAEFIIPNCKIQSNFTFSMAATGDPSTFTFTMDAFPDFTKYDKAKKVLCALRIEEEDSKAAADEFTGETTEKHPAPAGISYTGWRSAVATKSED